MNVTVLSAALSGVIAQAVLVEVKIRSTGYPGFHMVGLADTAVRESRVRVLTALDNAGYRFGDKSITINLAPADLPKSGSSLDLAIAVGLLGAAGVLPPSSLDSTLFLGELGLRGALRPVTGVLPAAMVARDLGLDAMVVPSLNGSEAASVTDLEVAPAGEFTSVVEHLCRRTPIEPAKAASRAVALSRGPDLAQIRGQLAAKRALEVAAAGGHNLLLTGPPGSGKTMLARAFAEILPPLTSDEALESASVHSVAGLLRDGGVISSNPPFRAPHHSVSHAGLVGGGSPPRPGEVSLAHNGVLFLDELPEFGAYTLDLLREPIEEGRLTIVRKGSAVQFPARFLLVGAMNPCRCGYDGHSKLDCTCPDHERRRYQSRISGPMMDRFDIRVTVPALSYEELTDTTPAESSESVRERVFAARRAMSTRWRSMGLRASVNARVEGRHFEKSRADDDAIGELIEYVVERWHLSARGYTRMLKVARTVADLDGSELVEREHFSEAVQYCRERGDDDPEPIIQGERT